jgi:hypothetical protein
MVVKVMATSASVRRCSILLFERSYDFNVRTAKKRVEKLRTMHRNPVKRELVGSPELWRWSSFWSKDAVENCGTEQRFDRINADLVEVPLLSG